MILSALIISACTTVEYVTPDYVLPMEPQRQNISLPNNPTLKDYATIIIYYDYLLRKWEQWAKTVKEIILTEKN